MNKSHKALVKDKLVTFTHIGSENPPEFRQVTSASAIPFTHDGRIVVVRLHNRGLDLPGGHVEPYETTPEETLHREIMEEASITITSPVLIDVVESDYFADRKSYMLLYAAFVDEYYDFVANDESSERIVMRPDDFIQQYTAWDKDLMAAAINDAWLLLKDTPV